jgi:nitrate reductase NapE component
MKSPLPTSFALLLAASLFVVLVFGAYIVTLTTELYAVMHYLGLLSLLLPGALIYTLMGVISGLRYRKERKALNLLGLCGNGLLLLAFIGLFGFAYWTKHKQTYSRRVGVPVEVARDYSDAD